MILGHINVRSIRNKIDQVYYVLNHFNFDVLCVTETWLNNNDYCAVPPGYDIVRNDRLTHGGGVAIIFKPTFKCTVVKFPMTDWIHPHNLEILCLNLQYSYTKSFYVCCMYRTGPASNDLQNLDNLCSYFNTLKKRVVLLGDFNVNLLSNSADSKIIEKILRKYSLKQIIECPTRGENLLDLIISNTDDCANSEVIDSSISDHLLTKCIFKNSKKTKSKKQITFRNYLSIDWVNFIIEMDSFTIGECNDVDTYFQLLTVFVCNLFNSYCPLKSKFVTNKKISFNFSFETKVLINLKRKNYRKLSKGDLKFLDKQIKSQIRSDFNSFVTRYAKSYGVWKAYQNIFNLQTKSLNTFNSNISVNEINTFFCHCAFPNDVNPYDTMSEYVCDDQLTENSLFRVKSVNSYDVIKAWKSLHNKHKQYEDSVGVSMKMLYILFPIPNFLSLLRNFCQLSFRYGKIPNELKVSKVIPIPKVNNAVEPNQFRPISISSPILLLLEKIYYNQLSDLIRSKKLISKFQFGFRANHSTEHAIIALTDFMKLKIDEGYFCVLVSIDLRKAFDSVPRDLLLKKLISIGISDFWLKDYLSNRFQFVSMDNMTSELRRTLIGVPQGSILGPILFSLYINDLPSVVKHCLSQLFADDSNFVFWGNIDQMEDVKSCVCRDLVEILKWANTNKMTLNQDKTKILMVSKPSVRNILSNFTINFDGSLIGTSEQLKCLGFILDPCLNFENHINCLSQLCFSRIRGLYMIREYLSRNSMIILGQALILSLINYMSSVWGNTRAKYLKVIEKVVRALARLVLKKKKCDRVAKIISEDLEWFFPSYLCDYKTLCIMFKLYKYRSVEYFDSYYVPVSSHIYNTRFDDTERLKTPFKSNSNFGSSTFLQRSINLWNELPLELKKEDLFPIFQKQLKMYLLKKQCHECA